MKVTVCFGSVRVVVPCGDGNISVRDLINQATVRYKKASGKGTDSWVMVHNIQSRDGGILDPDDRLSSVVDDREQIVAIYEDVEGMHHAGGDGASACSSVGTNSPDIFQDIGNTENGYLSPTSWKDGDLTTTEEKHCSAFTRFVRDGSSRLSMQFTSDSNVGAPKWIDAADKLTSHQSKSLPRERRRKEPLGEAHTAPTNNNNRLFRTHVEDKLLTFHRPEYVVINNDGEALGIHVVPDYDSLGEEQGILVQGIEPRGKVARDGTLSVYDRIVEINGKNLVHMPFHRVQDVFRDALHSPELRLRILRRSSRATRLPPAPVYPRSLISCDKENHEAMVEGEERSVSGYSKLATVSPTKKLSPSAIEAQQQVLTTARGGPTLQVANTRKIGRKIELQLDKGPYGLGFSITTRDNPAGGNCPIYVKNILPKGAAVNDGRLKPGDRLLEVNGIEMTGKTQSEAVSVLRNAPPGSKVRIVVSRQEDIITSSPKLPRPIVVDGHDADTTTIVNEDVSTQHNQDITDNVTDNLLILPWKQRQVFTFDIPVHDTEKAGLGVSVKGKTSAGNDSTTIDLGIFVKSVLHGGAASRDGRLRTNDQLLNVNGITLLGQSNSEAMETLRQAMLYTEGAISGVISLTVARKVTPSGRDSTSSILSSSSGTETFGEGVCKLDNSEHSDNTVISLPNVSFSSNKSNNSNTTQHSDGSGINNPVIERLTGKQTNHNSLRNHSYFQATRDVWNTTVPMNGISTSTNTSGTLSPTVNLPSEETLMIEQEALPPPPPPRHILQLRTSKGVRTIGEVNNIQQQQQQQQQSTTTRAQQHNTATSSDYSGGSSHGADATYASQLSLEDNQDGFSRDAFGRQSMSEKRHAALDAKNTDTYQRNKKLREERDRQKSNEQLQQLSKSSHNSNQVTTSKEQHVTTLLRANSVESVVSISRLHADSDRTRNNEFGPSLGMKKSSSLESLQTVIQEMQMQGDCDVYRNVQGAVRSVRGRGCNESFRAAVDRSYDAPLAELRSRIEMETLCEEDGMTIDEVSRSFVGSRGCPRQSSLNAILDSKNKSTKKKASLLKGIGSMFK